MGIAAGGHWHGALGPAWESPQRTEEGWPPQSGAPRQGLARSTLGDLGWPSGAPLPASTLGGWLFLSLEDGGCEPPASPVCLEDSSSS